MPQSPLVGRCIARLKFDYASYPLTRTATKASRDRCVRSLRTVMRMRFWSFPPFGLASALRATVFCARVIKRRNSW